jgi:hypothetical protein
VLELGGFTMLTTLDLYHCTVPDEEVPAVGTLMALTTHNLFGCRKVTDVAAAALSGLTALTVLDLGGSQTVTDVGVGACCWGSECHN